MGLCSACHTETTNRCSKCKKVYFCSRKCQVKQYKMHKQVCGHLQSMNNLVVGESNEILDMFEVEDDGMFVFRGTFSDLMSQVGDNKVEVTESFFLYLLSSLLYSPDLSIAYHPSPERMWHFHKNTQMQFAIMPSDEVFQVLKGNTEYLFRMVVMKKELCVGFHDGSLVHGTLLYWWDALVSGLESEGKWETLFRQKKIAFDEYRLCLGGRVNQI